VTLCFAKTEVLNSSFKPKLNLDTKIQFQTNAQFDFGFKPSFKLGLKPSFRSTAILKIAVDSFSLVARHLSSSCDKHEIRVKFGARRLGSALAAMPTTGAVLDRIVINY